FIVCTVIVLVGVQELQGFNIDYTIMNTEDIMRILCVSQQREFVINEFDILAALVGLSMYLLLWINTKPRETANAVYKNSRIVRL
ncbi:MAG: hypothetical protein RR797_02790, partial [Christensenella sp.]